MEKNNKKQEEMQARIYEFQILQQEMKNIDQQMVQFENRKLEMQMIKIAIDEIKNSSGSSVMVPLGAGVFMNGTVRDDSSVFVNVGAGIVIKKELADAKKIIDYQISQVDNNLGILQKTMGEIEAHLQKLAAGMYQ